MKRADGRDELLSAADRIGVSLSAEAADRLLAFEALLREKAIPLGFVSRSDEPRLRDRHVLDSLRATAEIRPGDGTAVDLGSGAGLPGVVLAIAAPELHVRLVEPQRRRVAFLELALERIRLANAEILPSRAEDEAAAAADLCTARAFAPPDLAWRAAERLLAPGGRLIYFAGAGTSIEAPPGARILSTRSATLESSGPLVIMSR